MYFLPLLLHLHILFLHLRLGISPSHLDKLFSLLAASRFFSAASSPIRFASTPLILKYHKKKTRKEEERSEEKRKEERRKEEKRKEEKSKAKKVKQDMSK